MLSLVQKISDHMVDKKNYYLIGLILIMLLGGFFLKNLRIENSLNVWFLEEDITLKLYTEFKAIYGTDEVIMTLVDAGGKGIYDKEYVEKIYDISKKIEAHDLIKRVSSITNATSIRGKTGLLEIEKMLPDRPSADFKSDELKKRLTGSPLWRKLLLNNDGKATVLIIEPESDKDIDRERPVILAAIREALNGVPAKICGMGVVYDEINSITMKESGIFFFISFLILIGSLYFFFRKVSVIVAAVMTIIISIGIYLGIYGMSGKTLDMMSAIIPSLISILALSEIIHIFSHYDKTPAGPNRLKRNLHYILLPCLFTSITSAVGFFGLVSSPMAILKNFGYFSSIGIIIGFVVTIIVCNWVIGRMEQRKGVVSYDTSLETVEEHDFFDRLLRKLNQMNRTYYKQIIVVSFFLLAIAVWGITKLSVDTYSIDLLLDSNSVKKDSDYIEKSYGFYLPLEVRLRPRNADGVKDPSFLKKLEQVQIEFAKQPTFQRATSFADLVKEINMALNDGKKSEYRIPDTRDMIAQELLLYEMDEENTLSSFVNADYTEARLTLSCKMGSAKTIGRYIKEAEKILVAGFGNDVEFKFGGYGPLYVKLIEYITISQVTSFPLSILIIFGMLAILFRSLSVIIMGIIPNLFPIFLTLAFMGWSGINLDIATVTIASIVIGIAVDDTIHFIFMYRKKRGEGASVAEAVEVTVLTTGKAIIITSLLLVVGFMVFLLASIKSIIFFGLLISVTMIAGIACDLIMLPAMLLFFAKKK